MKRVTRARSTAGSRRAAAIARAPEIPGSVEGGEAPEPPAVVREIDVMDPGGEAGLGERQAARRERAGAVDGHPRSGQGAGAGGGVVRVRHDPLMPLVSRPGEAGGETLGRRTVPSGDPHRQTLGSERPRGVRSESAVAAEDHDHRCRRKSRATSSVHTQ
jgi:hypothetical protein